MNRGQGPPASASEPDRSADGAAAATLEQAGIAVRRLAPIGRWTWYRAGGSAAVLAEPADAAQAAHILRVCRDSGVPHRVLGGGANLLVREGVVPGVTLRLTGPGLVGPMGNTDTNTDTDTADVLRVGGGTDLFTLLNAAARRGLTGLEHLAGVPGTVGGAVVMNAGGRHGDTAQAVDWVELLTADGQHHRVGRNGLTFGYRRCRWHGGPLPLVLAAGLRVRPADPAAVRERLRALTLEKRNSQPMADRSAGCCFRNPGGDAEPAGRLIDTAGLKGFRIGAAEVSPLHANFVTLDPGGRTDDVVAVLEHMEAEVQRVHGVRLARELVVW